MIETLVRRTVLALSVLCLAASAVANSYHPHILKSQVVSLDVKAIETAANSGRPFEIAFEKNPLTLAVSPAPLWPEEGAPVLEVGRDGAIKKRTVTGNFTYAGDVVGEDADESEVRFAIVNGILDGYVLSKTGWWFIEPLSRFDPKAGSDQYLVYATRDLDFVINYGEDGVKADEVIGWDGGTVGFHDGRIPLLMVADYQYITRSGALPYEARHATLVNMINGIYKRETGRQFRISGWIGDFGNTFLTATFDQNLLIQLSPFVNFAAGLGVNAPRGAGLKVLHSFLAHLTTAKDLDGNAAGVSDEPGVFGLTQQIVSPVGGGTTALSFQNMMVAAHELGHNFFGTHAMADQICVDDGLFGCWDYRRTLMWPEFHGDNFPRFSDGTHNPAHNNRKSVTDLMTVRGF